MKNIFSSFKVNFDHVSSMEPYGITYSDPYQLQRISLFSSDKSVSIHISRIYQFHQAPATKFFYDCVSELVQNVY